MAAKEIAARFNRGDPYVALFVVKESEEHENQQSVEAVRVDLA